MSVENNVPEISMTTFVDFVLATGTKRLTCVKKAKKDYGKKYDPARDFYRLLRDKIMVMHQESKPKGKSGRLHKNNFESQKDISVPRMCGYI